MLTRLDQIHSCPRSLYEQKEPSYFSYDRVDLVQLIDGAQLKILELGCGEGETGKSLVAAGKARWLTGIEMLAEKGERARAVFDEVHIGNVEEMSFDWNVGDFDCFVFGDVLEHLADPWGLLKRLRPFLADEGIVVASVPNVKYWPVIANLIFRDQWKYAESGVLDATHLRFFTRTSAASLFCESGYSVDIIRPSFTGRRYLLPNKLTFGAFAGFLAQKWLMRLKATVVPTGN